MAAHTQTTNQPDMSNDSNVVLSQSGNGNRHTEQPDGPGQQDVRASTEHDTPKGNSSMPTRSKRQCLQNTNYEESDNGSEDTNASQYDQHDDDEEDAYAVAV